MTAKIVTKKLTDGSQIFGVIAEIDGQKLLIDCTDRRGAQAVKDSIDAIDRAGHVVEITTEIDNWIEL